MIELLVNGFIKMVVIICFTISQVVQISVGLIFFIFTLPLFLYLPFVWFAGLFMENKKEV